MTTCICAFRARSKAVKTLVAYFLDHPAVGQFEYITLPSFWIWQ